MREFLVHLSGAFLRSPRACLRALYQNEVDACLWRKASKLAGTVQLQPNNIEGVFAADLRSHIALRVLKTGEYEPEILARVRELREQFAQRDAGDGVIVNIGANIGLVSVFLARHFGRPVVAIEPNPEAFALLAQNIKLNRLEGRIRPAQVCIGEREETLSFSTIPGKPEYSSLGGIVEPSVRQEAREENVVQVMPLTKVVSERIAMLFIDVEGAEEMVFRGAESIISRDRPIIVSECSAILLAKFGSSVRKVYEYLVARGYAILVAETGRAWSGAEDFESFNGNIVALPSRQP